MSALDFPGMGEAEDVLHVVDSVFAAQGGLGGGVDDAGGGNISGILSEDIIVQKPDIVFERDRDDAVDAQEEAAVLQLTGVEGCQMGGYLGMLVVFEQMDEAAGFLSVVVQHGCGSHHGDLPPEASLQG